MLTLFADPRRVDPGLGELAGVALVVLGLLTFGWCYLLARRAWWTWGEGDDDGQAGEGK